MKKKSGSRIVRVFSRIINIRTWFDWDRMKAFTLFLGNGFKRLFVPQKNSETASFELAMKQLKLTDADLVMKRKALFRLSMIMLVIAFLILVYTGYQLFYGTYKAASVSFAVMMIALVLAFRYHFWYFQIKVRKLGCTFDEWFKYGFKGENNE